MQRWLQSFLLFWTTLLFPARKQQREVADISPEDISHLPPAHTYDTTYVQSENCETYSLFSYKDSRVQALIWELKYHRNSQALDIVGRLLAEAITEELSDRSLFENWTNALLVPIPTHSKRLREKQFSQTDLLCREIYKHFDHTVVIYAPHALAKVVETEKQNKTTTRAQRLVNVKDTFRADEKLVANRNIILIDDVTTTGATIREAVRALRVAGTKHIMAFTVAH